MARDLQGSEPSPLGANVLGEKDAPGEMMNSRMHSPYTVGGPEGS